MENGWLAGTQRERGAGSTSGPSGETKTPFPVPASRGWGGGAADLGAGDRGRSGPPAAVGGRAPWRGAGWFQDRAAVRGVLPGCRVEETPFPTTQQDSPGRASPSRGGDSLSGAVQNPRPPAPPPQRPGLQTGGETLFPRPATLCVPWAAEPQGAAQGADGPVPPLGAPSGKPPAFWAPSWRPSLQPHGAAVSTGPAAPSRGLALGPPGQTWGPGWSPAPPGGHPGAEEGT